MDSITSSPVTGSLGPAGLTKKPPPKAAPQVTGGLSSWLESGVSLLKASAVFYLLRCTGAQPTSTQTPSGTLLPDSVAQYESAEDLVRELASSVGIDHFHVSNAQPYDDWRYKLAPGPSLGLSEVVVQGLEQVEFDDKSISLHVNAYEADIADGLTDPGRSEYYGSGAWFSGNESFPAQEHLGLSAFNSYDVPVGGAGESGGIPRSVPFGNWSNMSTLLLSPSSPLADPAKFQQIGIAVCNLTSSRGSHERVIFVTPLTDAVRPGYERMLKDGKFEKHCPQPPQEPGFWKTPTGKLVAVMLSMVGAVVVCGAGIFTYERCHARGGAGAGGGAGAKGGSGDGAGGAGGAGEGVGSGARSGKKPGLARPDGILLADQDMRRDVELRPLRVPEDVELGRRPENKGKGKSFNGSGVGPQGIPGTIDSEVEMELGDTSNSGQPEAPS